MQLGQKHNPASQPGGFGSTITFSPIIVEHSGLPTGLQRALNPFGQTGHRPSAAISSKLNGSLGSSALQSMHPPHAGAFDENSHVSGLKHVGVSSSHIGMNPASGHLTVRPAGGVIINTPLVF